MPRRQWSFFMPAQDHFFLKRVLTIFNICFTQSGKILLCTLFVSAAIAAPGLHLSAYLFPCFILPLLLTAVGFSYFFRPQVRLLRQLPGAVSAGEYLITTVTVKNTSRRSLRKFALYEGLLPFGLYSVLGHESFKNTIDYLRPGESDSVQLLMHCQYRGVYQLTSLFAVSSFPSGIFRFPVRILQSDKLIVYPKFVSQTEFNIPVRQVYQPGGIAVSSEIGSSNEFLNTREYRHGDRLRDIHWASYARTGKLIVKEYVDEYFVRVGLFLDTEKSKGEEPSSFERRIAIAAGVADAVARREYIIDLFAAGEELYHFQVGRSLAHLENLLELLSCLEDTKRLDFKKVQLSLKEHIRELSSMVIILKDWDEERLSLCRSLECLGLSLKIMVVRDKPLTLSSDRELVVVSAKKNEGLIR